MRIRFVRLKKSEMIKEAIEDRLFPVLEKFNLCEENEVFCEVEMENSPHQAGRDLFRIKLNLKSGEMKGFMLEKSDPNFYRALSSLVGSLPANIKKYREKKSRIEISKLRRLKNAANL